MSIHDQQSKPDQSLPDQVAASELRERAEKALAALKPPPATPKLQSLASSSRTSHISGSSRLTKVLAKHSARLAS